MKIKKRNLLSTSEIKHMKRNVQKMLDRHKKHEGKGYKSFVIYTQDWRLLWGDDGENIGYKNLDIEMQCQSIGQEGGLFAILNKSENKESMEFSFVDDDIDKLPLTILNFFIEQCFMGPDECRLACLSSEELQTSYIDLTNNTFETSLEGSIGQG